jgi:purine-binding chemotaxis protein CheW
MAVEATVDHAPVPPTQALLQQFDSTEHALSAHAAAGASPGHADIEVRQGFRVGPLHLSIRDEDGSELAELPTVHRLPNAPAWFTGMANLHGALIPVFDLAPLLGVKHDPDAKPMLLVLGHGEDRAGISIDGIPRRLRVTAADRLHHSTPPRALAGCVTGALRADAADWLDLQPAPLLARLADLLAA